MSDSNVTYLQIGDNYRVSRDDDRNLMLEQFKTVTSAPNRHQKVHKSVDKWVWMGFYQSLKTVMDRVLQEEISQNLNGNIHDIIAVIDDTKQEIFDAIDEAGTTLESFPKTPSGRGKTVEVAKVETKKATKASRKHKAKAKA